MQVDIDIVFNFLCDLKKKDIDKLKRAKLVREYLNETGISERELSRQLGFEDEKRVYKWLLYEKIDPKEYKRLIAEGFHDTDIFDTLNKKQQGHYADMIRSGQTDLDKELSRCIFKLNKIMVSKYKVSSRTKTLCKELRDIVNLIQARM